MEQIYDRPILERDRSQLVVRFAPLRRIARRARFVENLIDVCFAIPRIVERLLAPVEAEDVAIRVRTTAPREHVRFVLALVCHVERR